MKQKFIYKIMYMICDQHFLYCGYVDTEEDEICHLVLT